jgi:hypothetical protein
MVNLGIDESYAVERMRSLILHPEFPGEGYIWRMGDTILSRERDLIFCQADTGTYDIQLEIQDKQNPDTPIQGSGVGRASGIFALYIARAGV